MLTEIKLQKKRERKAARRRFVNRIRKQFFIQFGPYKGEELYHAWRRGEL